MRSTHLQVVSFAYLFRIGPSPSISAKGGSEEPVCIVKSISFLLANAVSGLLSFIDEGNKSFILHPLSFIHSNFSAEVFLQQFFYSLGVIGVLAQQVHHLGQQRFGGDVVAGDDARLEQVHRHSV